MAKGNDTVFQSWSEAKKLFGCNAQWLSSLVALYNLPVVENIRASLVSIPGISYILNVAPELKADAFEWSPEKVVEDIKREVREEIRNREIKRIETLLNM